jgi:hypothetical protein
MTDRPAPSSPSQRRDLWQTLGLAAFITAALLLVLDVASWFDLVAFDRDYPGTLILLAVGGTILLGYRSGGGLLAGKSPDFRRALGLALAIPGFFLALLEVTR